MAQFQLKKADKDGIFDIVKTINSVLDTTSSLSPEMLKKTFDRWWPDLEKEIKELPVLADKIKRTQEEMLEEILNSVRALSNMVSEQGSLKPFVWAGSTPTANELARLYRGGAGIGSRSTGMVIEPMFPSLSPSPSPSHSPSPAGEPTDDKD